MTIDMVSTAKGNETSWIRQSFASPTEPVMHIIGTPFGTPNSILNEFALSAINGFALGFVFSLGGGVFDVFVLAAVGDRANSARSLSYGLA